MFPDFQYLLHGLTGLEMPHWLSLFKTFGFLVALSFLGAAWVMSSELRRKTQQGLLHPEIKQLEINKPLNSTEMLTSAVVAFLAGFKIGGIFSNFDLVSPDPMGYLFSSSGNFIIGIAAGVGAYLLKLMENKKIQSKEQKTVQVKVYPHELITEIVVVAAVAGLVGAKVFNALETWDDFIKDPIRSLTSSSGLTFLGGLIMATAAFYYYARKHKIPFAHLADAAAPAIMLAYGLGRLGCHFSGDGDWGIFNTAYMANPDGTMRATTAADMGYVQQMAGTTPFLHMPAPSWLPDWLMGMVYPHNVGHEGIAIKDCVGEYCNVLPVSVFPTSVYEFVACVSIFAFMWAIRKKLNKTLQMFGMYLLFAGVERFLVEKIRVNTQYDLGFIHPTQAEILSVFLMIAGAVLLLRKSPAIPADNTSKEVG